MANTIQKALNLDPKSQKKFIEFYQNEIEKQSKDTRVFHAFERNEYFSIHGSDVDIALKTALKSSIIVKMMAPEAGLELRYATLNRNLMERLIRELLLVQFYRVEVYVNKKDEYCLSYKGSPGNLAQFETLLSNSADSEVFSNLLVSLQLSVNQQQKKIGLCSIDSDESMIHVAEFDDTDFFMELEAALVVLSPKEVLLPSVTGDYEKIKEVLDRNNILTTQLKKSDYATNSEFHQDLEKIYRFRKEQQRNIHALPEVKLDVAMGALAAAMKYLDIVNEENSMSKFSVKVLNLNRFVHMDISAFNALNLFPTPGTSFRSQNYRSQSVLGVLDRCKTNQGRRLLRQWIKQPLKNLEMITERLDVVQSFVEAQEVQSTLFKEYLNIIPDILMLTNKLSRKRGSLIDVFKIYQVIRRIPEIVNLLNDLDCNAIRTLILSPLNDLKRDFKKICTMIEEVIDSESLKRGEYLVRASFDPELNEIKEKMDEIEAKMNKETKHWSKTLGLDDLKLDYVSHLGYYFRLSRKEDQNIRKFKQFEVIDTAKGGLRATTAKLRDLNADYAQLKETYEEQQKKIVDEICRVTQGYSLSLTSLNHIIATLDVFVSLSQVVLDSPGSYVRPQMFSENERVLQIEELRHPCLECQEDMEFIPNDVNFKQDESEFLIITGANISGKSTYIRSIGIAVLLAHIGCFVPCESAKISIFDSILARIGATDDIQKNLSTFAMEMVETSAILRTATKNSLIIIDELGRGTSTFEGMGLAWAISEHLAMNVKCFTLFATHFHEITALADELPNVKNYHLASLVENDKLTLLFKVKPGAMTKSFGIQVATIAQLPESVISSAKRYLDELEVKDAEDEPSEKVAKIEDLLKRIEEDKNFDIDSLSNFL